MDFEGNFSSQKVGRSGAQLPLFTKMQDNLPSGIAGYEMTVLQPTQ
jgi:hypothetical protein